MLVNALLVKKSTLAETKIYQDPPSGHKFNRRVRRTGTKAAVSVAQCTALIGDLMDTYPGENLHVYVDKQGGRHNLVSHHSELLGPRSVEELDRQ